MVVVLLEHKVDVDAVTDMGTALTVAASSGGPHGPILTLTLTLRRPLLSLTLPLTLFSKMEV